MSKAEKQEKAIISFEDVDTSRMVDAAKALRAFTAFIGRSKPGSAELALVGRFRAEGYDGQELVEAIYEGLGGLMSAEKAKKNRANEAKQAKKKRSR